MYAPIDPYETGLIDVDGGHTLYWETSGNPQGIPAVFLHGGPGGGIHPDMRRFFDPARYRIILFDQRGCGKSTPFASLENNDIDHLVDDVETIRKSLGVKKWLVSGSSWGSTLSLLYAIKYPETVAGLVVSGIFFADKKGANWLAEEGGASEMFDPKWFSQYRDFIPPDKRKQGLIAAYDQIMKTGSESEIIEAAKCFTLWDTAIIAYDLPVERLRVVENDPKQFVPLCRSFFHFANTLYTDDNKTKILDGVKKLPSIPFHIIHGQWDLICPVKNAFNLHSSYPSSVLHILPNTGHTIREPHASKKMVEITENLFNFLT
jgi:proline iminopeptidase